MLRKNEECQPPPDALANAQESAAGNTMPELSRRNLLKTTLQQRSAAFSVSRRQNGLI